MMKKKFWKKIVSGLCICSLLAGVVIYGPAISSDASGNSAVEQKTPEQLGYERITVSEFTNTYNNIAVADGTYTAGETYSGKGYVSGAYTGTSLDGKYLDIDIKTAVVGSEGSTRIQYGGGAGEQYWGLRIVPFWSAATDSVLRFSMSMYPNEVYDLKFTDLGIEDPHAIDINLKIATKVVGNDVQADVWVDDVQQERMTFTGAAGEMGKWIGIWTPAGGTNMTVGTPTVVVPEPIEQKTPEELGYERITVSEFTNTYNSVAVADGTYTAGETYSGPGYVSGAYTGTSLDGKYLDVDIQTGVVGNDETSTRIQYGGGTGEQYWGLRIVPYWSSATDSVLRVSMSQYRKDDEVYDLKFTDLGIENPHAIDINLKIATTVVGDDVQADVWVDDVRQERMTFTGAAGEMGKWIGIWTPEGGTNMTVGTPTVAAPPSEEENPVEQKTPEELGYERIAVGEFANIYNGEYVKDGTYEAGETYSGNGYISGAYTKADSLDGKYLDVDIKTGVVGSEGSTRIQYGGGTGEHYWGLRIVPFWSAATDSVLRFSMSMYPNEVYDLKFDDLGITDPHAIDINLKIATTVVGDDVQADVWVDDVRQERMTFTGAADEMGKWIGFWVPEGGKNITIATPGGPILPGGSDEPQEPVEQKTPEELGYEKVILEEFGIADQTYEVGSDMVYGNYVKGDSLEGKYLDVDITTDVSSGKAYINFGGNIVGGWYGVRLSMLSDAIRFSMCLNEGSALPYTLKHTEIGLTKPTDKFNLKIAVEVSEADVIAHVWINDVRQQPMRFNGCATEIGDWLGVYAKDQTITVATPGANYNVSGTPEKIDETFRKITFGNFKLKDGTYAYTNDKHTFVNGAFGLKLHKTVFTGNLVLASGQGDFRYGGKVNGWYGLRFWKENGNLFMQDVDGKTDLYIFLPSIAGVSFDSEFNLSLTTEYVDSDKDGVKDDVKFGVWFNNKLYKNQYIYLQDYQPYMGRYVGVFSGASAVTVKSVLGIETGVDYTIWGYTRNWKRELGIK